MNDLILEKYDKNLISLGFYPSKIGNQKIEIMNIKEKKILSFELENDYFFDTFKALSFPEFIPTKVKNAVQNNEWFDDFYIAQPKKEKQEIKIPDPFLFGEKNGFLYFICAWDTNIWER